jgi:thiamine biosynthesis lipoprotein
MNPFTGWPTHGLASVSVTADKCVAAGSISTIAMLKGVNGPDWLKNIKEPYLFVDENSHVEGTMKLTWAREE